MFLYCRVGIGCIYGFTIIDYLKNTTVHVQSTYDESKCHTFSLSLPPLLFISVPPQLPRSQATSLACKAFADLSDNLLSVSTSDKACVVCRVSGAPTDRTLCAQTACVRPWRTKPTVGAWPEWVELRPLEEERGLPVLRGQQRSLQYPSEGTVFDTSPSLPLAT